MMNLNVKIPINRKIWEGSILYWLCSFITDLIVTSLNPIFSKDIMCIIVIIFSNIVILSIKINNSTKIDFSGLYSVKKVEDIKNNICYNIIYNRENSQILHLKIEKYNNDYLKLAQKLIKLDIYSLSYIYFIIPVVCSIFFSLINYYKIGMNICIVSIIIFAVFFEIVNVILNNSI